MHRSKYFRRLLTALLAAALLFGACVPGALAAVSVRIIANTNVYSIPSTSGSSIRVPKGLECTMTAFYGDWARVSYRGYTAYIPLPYLDLVNRLTAYTAKSTPVYRSASTTSQKLGTLSIATAVYVVGRAGNFFRIQNANASVTGYVEADYLTTRANITAAYNAYANAQTANASASTQLLNLLQSLNGKPYGDDAPNSFNNSTLAAYAMGRFGIQLKATAAEQAADERFAKITNPSDLRLGDIVCFDQTGNGACDLTASTWATATSLKPPRAPGRCRSAPSPAGIAATTCGREGPYKRTPRDRSGKNQICQNTAQTRNGTSVLFFPANRNAGAGEFASEAK